MVIIVSIRQLIHIKVHLMQDVLEAREQIEDSGFTEAIKCG